MDSTKAFVPAEVPCKEMKDSFQDLADSCKEMADSYKSLHAMVADLLSSWEQFKVHQAAMTSSPSTTTTPPPTAPEPPPATPKEAPANIESAMDRPLKLHVVPELSMPAPATCSAKCRDNLTKRQEAARTPAMPQLLSVVMLASGLPLTRSTQHKEAEEERPMPWPSFVCDCQRMISMQAHQNPQGISLEIVIEVMQKVLGCFVSSSASPMCSYGAKSYFQLNCLSSGCLKMTAQCLALLPSVNPAIYPPWRPPDRETHQAMIPGFPSVALSPNVHGDLSGWHSTLFHEKNDNGWLCVLHVFLSALAHFQWQIPWPSPQGCCAILSLWETYYSGRKLLQMCSVKFGLFIVSELAEFSLQLACAVNWMAILGFINDILGRKTFWLGIQVAANGVWWSFSWDLGEHNTCILTLHFQIHHVKMGQVQLFNIQFQFLADRALRSMSAPDWCISLWYYCQLHHMCDFVSAYISTEFFVRQHIRRVLVDKPWDPSQFTYCLLSRHELTTTFAAMDCHVTIVRVLTLRGHNSSSPIGNALSHSHGSEYVQWEIAWPSTIISEFWCLNPFWPLSWQAPIHNSFKSRFTKLLQIFLWSIQDSQLPTANAGHQDRALCQWEMFLLSDTAQNGQFSTKQLGPNINILTSPKTTVGVSLVRQYLFSPND